MPNRDDGGPAFPVTHLRETGRPYGPNGEPAAPGMTLRDYFIAHAPATPQPWFRANLPERPAAMNIPALIQRLKADGDETLAEEIAAWYHDGPDPESERGKKIQARWAATGRADEEWSDARERERWLQWPLAWADEMLKRRQS